LEKKLEGEEIVPLAALMFASYANAAKRGVSGDDCGRHYNECPNELIELLLRAKQNQQQQQLRNKYKLKSDKKTQAVD